MGFKAASPPDSERLFRFPKDKTLRWLDQVVCYREKHVRDEQQAGLRNLITAGAFEMHYEKLDSALRLLKRLVHGGATVAELALVTSGDRENG